MQGRFTTAFSERKILHTLCPQGVCVIPYKKISFQSEISEHLTDYGWLYAERDSANYDGAWALLSADV